MSNIVLLRPEALWVLILLPFFFLLSRRLTGLAPWRRRTALVLQSLSVALLLLAISQPALVKPDDKVNLVVVLDASKSLSAASRQQAVEYAKGVLAKSTGNEQIEFVSVGANATLLSAQEVATGSWAVPKETPQGASSGDSTDLSAGLRLAGTLLGDNGRRRVALVSDGWETTGQAAQEGDRLKARGIDVQVVGVSALGNPEVVAEALTVAPYVRIGDNVESNLSVFSTQATSATLQLSVDDTPLEKRTVALKQGENTIPFEQKASTEGYHHLDVTITGADDTSKENNSASAALVVKPRPRVLVLEDRAGEAAQLASALSASQMTVDVQSPASVPAQLSGLDDYDSVVLDNVAATSFTLDQQRTLQEYVRRNGRGLVVTGGKTSFARGAYADSIFEEMLPVSSMPPPRPAQGSTAVILVVDRSSSMDEGDNPADEPSKFAMAKEAARLAVDSLRPGDTLGVLTFDTNYVWAVPVQVINSDSDKARAKGLIQDISLGGGTNIFSAVEEAVRAMRGVSAPTKHVVLLTDGQDHSEEDFAPMLSQMRQDQIGLSTIGIGRDADKALLTNLAKQGQGRYYFTELPQNLPQIIFRELNVALKEAITEGSVQPHIQSPSPVLRGFAPQDVPQLGGYDLTTPKDDSVIALTSDSGDPLLAHWNYGLGRVLAFTSDTTQSWASRWLSWDSFSRFWSQAVRWTMATPVNPQLQPAITAESNTASITVQSLDAANNFAGLVNVTAAVRAPSGAITTTALTQSGPGTYTADLPLNEPGAYEMRLTREGDNATTETAGFSVPINPELLHPGTNDLLLKALNNGKDYLTTPVQALDSSNLQGTTPQREALWSYLIAPALLSLLASVAVRRVDFRLARHKR